MGNGKCLPGEGTSKNILETQLQKGTHKECTLSLHVDCLEKYLHKIPVRLQFHGTGFKREKAYTGSAVIDPI